MRIKEKRPNTATYYLLLQFSVLWLIQNALGPYLATSCSLTVSESLVLVKALFPIDVTDDGIVILVSELHLQKALHPIDVTDDGITICASAEHSLKVHFLIDITDDGIVIFVSEEH